MLKIEDVCERYSVSKETLYRRIRSGEFPIPTVQLGRNQWSEDVLDAFDRGESVENEPKGDDAWTNVHTNDVINTLAYLSQIQNVLAQKLAAGKLPDKNELKAIKKLLKSCEAALFGQNTVVIKFKTTK